MKRKIISLLCIVMVICFCSCTGTEKLENDFQTTSSSTTVSITAKSFNSGITDKTSISKTINKNENTKTNVKEATKKEKPKVENKQTTKSANQKVTTTIQRITTSLNLCYLTIDCTAALKNKDDLSADKKKNLPENGFFLINKAIELSGNKTAYDILKAACDKNKINLNSSSSFMGEYVVGIGNIDEKDCGGMSGWMYKVNGESPSKPCSSYDVSKGDSIVFYYVCS